MSQQSIKNNLEKISKEFFKTDVSKEMSNSEVSHKKMKLN